MPSPSLHKHFSPDYVTAREKFRNACAEAGLKTERLLNPETGMLGEDLTTDVVWIGPPDAERVLLTNSATHGVEGLYGSGCQVGFLREGHWKNLPSGVAMLVIHAINPYGFSWLRRVNEDNVDLNRNFLDFTQPLPQNPGYAGIHPVLAPPHWNPQIAKSVRTNLEEFSFRVGRREAAAAISAGQHTHPDGLFYGGIRPTWSNGVIAYLAARYLKRMKHMVVVDFHTGLGPYGHSELICRHPVDSVALKRARQWFGADVTSPAAGESDSPVIEGNLRMSFNRHCPGSEFTAFAIEVGTRDWRDVEMSLIADNWLHNYGEPRGQGAAPIKAAIRDAFYPDEDSWREKCYPRALEIQKTALAGLAGI
ncbi:MAG: M14 family metallopeptidase [Reyranellaceae bacterium]